MNAEKVRKSYRQRRFKYLFVMMIAGMLTVLVFSNAARETGGILSLLIAATTSFVLWYVLCNRKV